MFPETVYGKCTRCGGRGDGVQNSPADSDYNVGVVGTGEELILFRGDYICTLCRDTIIADEQSENSAERWEDRDSFLAQAGFKNSPE